MPVNERLPDYSHKLPLDRPSVPVSIPRASTSHSEAASRQNVKTTGHAVLSTLRGSMRLLKEGCKGFPPLQSASEILVEVLDTIEVATKGEVELLEMASDLPRWATILSSYLSEGESIHDSVPSAPKSELAENLANALREHAEKLEALQRSGRLKRALDSNQKIQELVQSYRQIETMFRQLHTNASLSTWKLTQDQFQISQLRGLFPSHNARYDSSFSLKVERRVCLQNTRATVLDQARRWIYSADGTKIYWLNGMAGTGKTTIAYSICSELELVGQLGANFFCSRSASDCQDINRILPTIAYQLAEQFYPFRSALCRILNEKPSVSRRNLSIQFQNLLKDPLLEMRDLLPSGIIVVIDALDECSDPKATEVILNLLFQDAAQLPIRFFLASRPDPSIWNTIITQDAGSRSVLHLHNVEEQLVSADIEAYLSISLAKASLTPEQIDQLTKQAGVLFIYASTVARYILSGRGGANRLARLNAVLNKDRTSATSKKNREIDTLYMTILDELLGDDQLEENEVHLIKRVLWTVVSVREPVTKSTMAALLGAELEQVSVALEPLRSVLNIIDGSEIVAVLHASFPEFILSPERSGQWSCHGGDFEYFMAVRCLKLMQVQLRFNICNLETPTRLDKDVPDLGNRVANTVSSELFYSCQYWSDHLRCLTGCGELLDYLNDFLRQRLLFWMEVLNLKGRIDKGTEILTKAWDWLLQGCEGSELQTFMYDASFFVHAFATQSVCQSTPDIYVSCLPLSPKKSKVWEVYGGRIHGLFQLSGTVIDLWHNQIANEFATSPARACIIASFMNRVKQPGNPSTEAGSPDKLGGHTDMITSVAFSSDGTRIVSGSADQTIRLWDSRSGIPLAEPLAGHTQSVTCVAFSPDDTRIISGSWDSTIRIWDPRNSSSHAKVIKGHIGMVSSVAFSLDGARFVSGSSDRTVRVWDSRKGTLLVGPFKGHINMVTSVTFSSEGSRIVSGSSDRTIRVWNSHHGTLVMNPFRGHTERVTSVAFSPDGTRIVSGSWDKTVRIWDSHAGTQVATLFKPHTGRVTSISLSLDGNQIVFGSSDHALYMGHFCDDPNRPYKFSNRYKAHEGSITCVAYSPDGKRIVSASDDLSIRVWDPDWLVRNRAWDCSCDMNWLLAKNSASPLGASSQQSRILWAPWLLHNGLPLPANVLAIKHAQSIAVHHDTLLLGHDWNRCFSSDEHPGDD